MSYIVETKFKIQTAQDVKLCGPYIAEAIPQIDIKVNGVSIEPTIKETGSGTDRFYACYQFPNTGTYNVTFTFPYPDWVNFRDCVFLSEVTLPEGITEIQDYAFYHTGIESIVIPDGVTSIGLLAFSESNLKSIYIPASVTSIVEGSSFRYTPYLESITVDPENAIYDSRDNCNCIIKDSTIIVGSKNYVIPASVNRIGKYAFYKHQFESFIIPYNITHIDEYAFSECNNFNKLYIGSQLSHIGEYAFSNCYHLHTIYSSAVTPPAYSNSSFYGLGNSIPARQGYLYVPVEAIPNYEAEWTYLTDTLGWIINE